MDVNAQLIFVDKTRPFPVQRAVYFQDPEFEGLYDPNTLMLSFGSP
jgi:type IV secretory pathway TraG/TraD family ATPase VirD4